MLDDSDQELTRLESRWRHVGDAVLVVAWLLVACAIAFIPLGTVSDTECGTLIDHTSSHVCDDRVRSRVMVLVAFIVVTVVGVIVVIARRRRHKVGDGAELT